MPKIQHHQIVQQRYLLKQHKTALKSTDLSPLFPVLNFSQYPITTAIIFSLLMQSRYSSADAQPTPSHPKIHNPASENTPPTTHFFAHNTSSISPAPLSCPYEAAIDRVTSAEIPVTTWLATTPPVKSKDKISVEETYPNFSESQYEKVKALVIESIKFNTKTNNVNIVKARTTDIKRVQNAVLAACNDEALLVLIKSGIKFYIAPESYMQSITSIADFSAAYLQSPYNAILINASLMFKWSNIKEEQLLTLLANEISHAVIHNSHPDRHTHDYSALPYDKLVPWTNPDEREKCLRAIKEYEDNIKTYQKLSKKSALSLKEKERLEIYNEAVKTYITPRYGEKGANAMQVYLTKSDNVISEFRDFSKQEPKDDAKASLDYKKSNFFQEHHNKNIQNEVLHADQIGIYTGNDNQILADKISDFEMLSPEMRRTFGPKLCEFLSGFSQQTNYCERPRWPKAPKLS